MGKICLKDVVTDIINTESKDNSDAAIDNSQQAMLIIMMTMLPIKVFTIWSSLIKILILNVIVLDDGIHTELMNAAKHLH